MPKKIDLNFGMIPFWFWNGEMKDDEIAFQIREMGEKGIGGFFIHPRQGLTIPYLSKEWFNKVGIAVEEAKKFGLDVWLYDEYPYPSGIAGGEVILRHPEFEAKKLECFRFDIKGPSKLEESLPWGNVLNATAYPINNGTPDWDQGIDLVPYIGVGRSEKIFQMSGLTAYNRKRYFEGDSCKNILYNFYSGEWRVYVFMEVTLEHMKFYGKFVDPVIPEAVKCFIETTHEQYKKHFGHEFGKTIKGIFSDEIDPIPPKGMVRWSSILPDLFYSRYGYSLTDKLPALFEYMGEETAKIRYDYWNTLVDAFVDSYDVQVHKWCSENNLLYVAEKPVLRSSQLQHIDIPGCDAAHQKVNSIPDIANKYYRANPKVISSAAHFYGKERALCECFHSVGWGMTIQDMKWMVDWLAIQGINLVNPHAFFYTTDGLTKHDAPPSPFIQQPYWKHMPKLSEYVDNLCSILSDGKRKVDILLVDPITSQWTAMGEKRDLKERLAEDCSRLQRELLENHWDYYMIDPRLLGQCEVKDGSIEYKEEKFSVLILPPMTNIEDVALKVIEEFIKGGGKIISYGCLPVEKVEEADTEMLFGHWFGVDPIVAFECYADNKKLSDNPLRERSNVVFVSDLKHINGVLERFSSRDISVFSEKAQNRDILGMHYIKEEGDYYYFINVSGKEYPVDIKLRYKGDGKPELVSIALDNKKEKKSIETRLDGEYLSISTTFAPFESYMFLLDEMERVEDTPIYSAQSKRYSKKLVLNLEEEWDFILEGLNPLRLNEWELQIEGINGNTLEEPIGRVNVICEPILDQISDSSIPLPLTLTDYFGCPKEMVFPSLKCRYSHEFVIGHKLSEAVIVMEPGSIEGRWEILINGYPIRHLDFTTRHVYMHTNLVVDVLQWLKLGVNKIDVIVETERKDDGLINPLYLFGDIGVFRSQESDMWELSILPKRGKINDTVKCGIPFYAGDSKHIKKLQLNDIQSDIEVVVENNDLYAPIELYINENYAGVRSFEPYSWHIDKAWLREGENEFQLSISSTLLALFEGQIFDPIQHKSIDID